MFSSVAGGVVQKQAKVLVQAPASVNTQANPVAVVYPSCVVVCVPVAAQSALPHLPIRLPHRAAAVPQGC